MGQGSLLACVVFACALVACSSGHDNEAGDPDGGVVASRADGGPAGSAGSTGTRGDGKEGRAGTGSSVETGEPGVPFASGVPGDKKLSELSDADEKKLCDALGSYVEDLVSGGALVKTLCAVTALLGSAFFPGDNAMMLCEMLYQECLAAPVMTTMTGMCDVKVEMTCEATVAQYEACVSEGVNMLDDVALSCADVGGPDVLTALPSGTGPACAELDEICPGASGSADVSGMMMMGVP